MYRYYFQLGSVGKEADAERASNRKGRYVQRTVRLRDGQESTKTPRFYGGMSCELDRGSGARRLGLLGPDLGQKGQGTQTRQVRVDVVNVHRQGGLEELLRLLDLPELVVDLCCLDAVDQPARVELQETRRDPESASATVPCKKQSPRDFIRNEPSWPPRSFEAPLDRSPTGARCPKRCGPASERPS